ncbi:MAG: betaine-aldehyde dehydrogenase [Hydrotalea sp.]|nr:betaine-aldehyde dehydrogenase [Hydrotalea sp.]
MTNHNLQPPKSHFVNGDYMESTDKSGAFDSLYPTTLEKIATLYNADDAVINAAIAAGEKAFAIWANTPASTRGKILRRAAELIRENNDELARIETLDTGKAIAETIVADALSGADCLDYFGGIIQGQTSDYIPLGDNFAYTRREPLGICLGLGAWNYPIQIACWKSAPCLATGNVMIFKPASVTPLSALKLAEIYKKAGLPDGVFQVLQGNGAIADKLVRHEKIAKVSLTGSVATGKKVMAAASETLKKVTLELGGKSPLIVFDSANIDAAVSGAILGNFYSSGQICSNGTRVFVQRGVYKEFLASLKTRAEKIILGDPLNPKTHLGPVVSQTQYDSILRYIDVGIKGGAALLTGGKPAVVKNFPKGLFIAPTVFYDCTDDMTICVEEIFGPVMSVLPFDSEEEVIARANHSTMGLSGGIFTNNLQQGHRVAAKLETGTIWINNFNITPIEMPFGGYKESGLGRENAKAVLESYTQIKSVYVEMGVASAPY